MAATEITVTAEVNFTLLENRIDEMLQNDSLRYAIHDALARYCHPYVPYLHGPLSETIIVTPDYVRYIQPYARYQYYGENFNHTTEYHQLATAKWDEAMMRDRGEEFCSEVQDILRRYLKNNEV